MITGESTEVLPVTTMRLRRFWFEFEIDAADWSSPVSGLKRGCGVTGHGRDECLELVRAKLLGGGALPPLRRVIEDVDVSTLDSNHVLPNMGVAVQPGIWFPLGYQ